MKDKNQKLITILNLITVICGIIALILFFKGGVDFTNPMIWFLSLIVLSSLSSLITQNLNKKEKKNDK